jgi:hypothetical protein
MEADHRVAPVPLLDYVDLHRSGVDGGIVKINSLGG